jgi:hypothetical protein
MIEPMMYMGIGFLVSALIGLAVMPLVHDRAVRLTTRRLRAALPQSMKEIQADRDLLRAEFAMSTRRLEMSLEHLKDKSTGHVVELSKRDDVINRLKLQRDMLRVDVIALNAQLEATKKRPIPVTKGTTDKASILSLMRQWIPQRSYR